MAPGHVCPKGRTDAAEVTGSAQLCGMARWQEFENAAPAMAAKGRALIYQHGAPLGYLATIRADGGPRIHPFCPVLAEGKLWAFILKTSPKCGDLLRDGRYALHAFPAEDVDDEFMARGRRSPSSRTSD